MDEKREMRDQSAKADAGKARISLVPMQILTDIAEVREYGVQKYSDPDNWMRVELDRYIDAIGRHYIEFVRDPLSVDEESGIEHYKHIACNLAFVCEFLKDAGEDDDYPNECDYEDLEWESVLDFDDISEDDAFRDVFCTGCQDYAAPETLSHCQRCLTGEMHLLSIGKKGSRCEAEYICKECEHIEKVPYRCARAEEFDSMG